MAAAPWYLLSVGIFVLLIGVFLANIRKPSGGSQTVIDPNLSDDEIMENLQGERGDPVSSLVILAGGLMILVSIVWRLLRLIF